MAPPNTKGIKIRNILAAHPSKTDQEIARIVGCIPNYVRVTRKKFKEEVAHEVSTRVEANRHEVPAHQQHLIAEHEWNGYGERAWCRHGIDWLGEPCDVCNAEVIAQKKASEKNAVATQEELDIVLEAASILNPASIDTVLTERGTRYGTFLQQAIITQRIKAVLADTPNWIALNDDMTEALEMIALKIGRILNGDPAYVDSWVDIAGYAQLVADRLQGKER